MANRFNVRVPVSEDPKVKEVEALHVKEIAEKDYEVEVLGTALRAWRTSWRTRPC